MTIERTGSTQRLLPNEAAASDGVRAGKSGLRGLFRRIVGFGKGGASRVKDSAPSTDIAQVKAPQAKLTRSERAAAKREANARWCAEQLAPADLAFIQGLRL